ncbi:MAG TPA: NAD(P)-dependent oxidoreductase [Burkholderiales bacterium]|nr:NAD(P)-dependent oxidoreductase [Burkholderiales bacterium]
MSAAPRPAIVVEDDWFLRIIGIVLDPATSRERIDAFADFFSCDLPDFRGWVQDVRAKVSCLYPANVQLVDSEAAYRDALPQADAVVIESLRVGSAELAAAPRLRAVQKFGAITRNIDLAACGARGIPVLTLRRRANIACAEHAMALMLALARKLTRVAGRVSIDQLRGAGFAPKLYDRRHTAGSNWARVGGLDILSGATLGIIGLGEIGRELATRAAAFGMRIVYHQRQALPAEEVTRWHAEYRPFEALLAECDWVSINVPGNPSTRHIFDRTAFAHMKPGARLVNVARADVVEREALIDALASGRLGGFALDPLYEAPGRGDDPLLAFENVIITPHLAAQPRFNALNDMRDLLTNLEDNLK